MDNDMRHKLINDLADVIEEVIKMHCIGNPKVIVSVNARDITITLTDAILKDLANE